MNICWKVDPDQKLWAFIFLRQGIISGQGLCPATYRIVKNLNSRKKKKEFKGSPPDLAPWFDSD